MPHVDREGALISAAIQPRRATRFTWLRGLFARWMQRKLRGATTIHSRARKQHAVAWYNLTTSRPRLSRRPSGAHSIHFGRYTYVHHDANGQRTSGLSWTRNSSSVGGASPQQSTRNSTSLALTFFEPEAHESSIV
eukprot:6183503-Pleurochrysis_carterae.AAC.2